jgi:hypothetical protein
MICRIITYSLRLWDRTHHSSSIHRTNHSLDNILAGKVCTADCCFPMFLKFTDEIIPYDGDAIIYPIFINEAAYL